MNAYWVFVFLLLGNLISIIKIINVGKMNLKMRNDTVNYGNTEGNL